MTRRTSEPAVPPAHTSVDETAGALPTANRGNPSTIVCSHARPSQCAWAYLYRKGTWCADA
ncbi:hypothetical protein [Streptomyces purpureus]|uniref:hypothetical protein n=1 Tax=Streptomyces purpureus TaxID=1951 RepID=UPI00131A2DEA|nr:hypothetical protein [Streptomyces purpureus]